MGDPVKSTEKECRAEVDPPRVGCFCLPATCIGAAWSCLILSSNLSLLIPGCSRRRVAAELIIASSLNQVINVTLWKHFVVMRRTELAVGWGVGLEKGHFMFLNGYGLLT